LREGVSIRISRPIFVKSNITDLYVEDIY